VLDELAGSMPRRHTNRQAFTPDPIPKKVATISLWPPRLRARSWTLRRTTPEPGSYGLIHTAAAQVRDEGVYSAEMAEWTRPRHRRGMGSWHAAETVPLRDFGMMTPHGRGPVDLDETYPTILVLSTDGDSRPDWIRAGQALERVWLTAVARGLAIAPMRQPLDTATG
jgi:hypothetical protein